MDAAEHPAVIATHQLVADYAEAVDAGKMQESMALAFLVSDVLGASVECAQLGQPEPAGLLAEIAATFAWRRRMLHTGTAPDNAAGLFGGDAA